MGIQTDKGRWSRSSLKTKKISSVRDKHPLNFQAYSVAAHHLISCEVAKKLSSVRKKQIVYKGYDINYLFNLTFLPTIDQVSCQYRVPLHKSGHTDQRLEEYYQAETGTSIVQDLSSLEANVANETNSFKSELLEGDLSLITSLSGYHKVVASMLAKKLKSVDCDTNAQEYVDTLDELSLDIADLIGNHKLHLIARGRHLSNTGTGCHFCRNSGGDRNHYDLSDVSYRRSVPTKEKVKAFCYEGSSLKTIGEQQ
ncbi:AHH domain-containing protein [Vibrio sp. 10N.222.55.A3]|uniref:AHH domain-containing protein n=1 Tax=unclassified Vibrio TaxID=2614977 RepID=UPI001E5A9008|nr:AHH domain-containing protein [Vibrio sp. F13]MCC4892294.1 AHH domain-containing protein [Vibrio sp. F13]